MTSNSWNLAWADAVAPKTPPPPPKKKGKKEEKILQKIEPLKFFPKCSIFCYPPAMILFTMIAINNLALIAELLWKIFIGCGHIAEQYSIK